MSRILLGCLLLAGAAAVAAQERPSLKPEGAKAPPAPGTPKANAAASPQPEPRRAGLGFRRLDAAKVDTKQVRDEVDKLKDARQDLESVRAGAVQALAPGETAPGTTAMSTLQLRLAEVLLRLDQPTASRPVDTPVIPRPLPPEKAPPGTATPGTDRAPGRPVDLSDLRNPADPLALGHSLFRLSQYEEALKAYRLVDMASLKEEERLSIQYLMATCLRRIGQTQEAVQLYQEVLQAGPKADKILAECAQWQLDAIQWHRDVDKELNDLRAPRTKGGASKP